jgi:hypothetical protein
MRTAAKSFCYAAQGAAEAKAERLSNYLDPK